MSDATRSEVRARSRTGCLTCKKRRIRCGEERPACVRCTSTGRRCDGYQEPNSAKHTKPQPMILMIVSDFTGQNSDSSVHLQYFFQVSAPALTNHRTSAFWNTTVLQICHQVPCIRDLAIAVAALERPLRAHVVTALHEDEPTIHMTHYGRALKQLTADQDIGVVLVGCLMMILLEDLRRNPYTALIHVRAGRQLLTQTLGRGMDVYLFETLQTVFRALFEHQPELTSHHLHVHGTYRRPAEPSPPPIRSTNPCLASGGAVAGFASLEHASEALKALRQPCISPPPFSQPLSRFHVVPGVTEALNDWLERFDDFVSQLDEEQQANDKIMIHGLRAYHLILRIASCCTNNTETYYNYYAQDLEGLGKRLSILSSLGCPHLAALIFFVACKHRDVADRQRAIGLLRYQSSGWKGTFLAEIADVIVRLEEQGTDDPITHEDIPASHRVRPRAITLNGKPVDQDILVLTRHPFDAHAPVVEVIMNTPGYQSFGCVDAATKNAVLTAAINLHFPL